MARIINPTPEQERIYREWVASRPEKIRRVAERFDPWSLYRLKSTGHRVTVYSFSEPLDDAVPVTLVINVTAEFNALMFERQVFGVPPDDLEPCELPAADEPRGALLTQDEVTQNLDALRAIAGIHKQED